MKILGIDPGTRNCGYAIVEKVGNKKILIEAGLIKIKQDSLQYHLRFFHQRAESSSWYQYSKDKPPSHR